MGSRRNVTFRLLILRLDAKLKAMDKNLTGNSDMHSRPEYACTLLLHFRIPRLGTLALPWRGSGRTISSDGERACSGVECGGPKCSSPRLSLSSSVPVPSLLHRATCSLHFPNFIPRRQKRAPLPPPFLSIPHSGCVLSRTVTPSLLRLIPPCLLDAMPLATLSWRLAFGDQKSFSALQMGISIYKFRTLLDFALLNWLRSLSTELCLKR